MNSTTKRNNEQSAQKTDIRCYSCGNKGHRSDKCPNKSKGVKCFRCNEYGHKAPDCTMKINDKTGDKDINNISINSLENMYKTILFENTPVKTLIDTGSQLNLIKENIHKKIGSPALQNTTTTLSGFAKSCTKTKGLFKCDIIIDNNHFSTNVYVVSDEVMKCGAIVGA